MQPDMEMLIAQLRALHRQRMFAMETRKASDLRLGAYLRLQFGWSKALPDKQRNDIAKAAKGLIECGEAVAVGKPHNLSDTEEFKAHEPAILASIMSRTHIDALEASALKAMNKLAKTLPVWETFGEKTKGFSKSALAIIAAEAGDLANYSNPGKLWKRMGLAPHDGKAASTWLRPTWCDRRPSSDEWVEMGYSPKRRSLMFIIGNGVIGCMGKGPRPLVGEDISKREDWTEYQKMFVERLRHEATKNPEHRRPDTAEGKESYSLHAARMAQRYVEKRLLRDLWRAWRGEAECGLSTISQMPHHTEQRVAA